MLNRKKILAESLFFSGIPEPLLDRVANVAQEKKFGRNEAIFFEGDAAAGFYMVAQGRVRIFKMSLDGKEQILHIFGPGEPFGEVPVFHGRPFPANAVSMEDSVMLFFPRQDFIDLLTAEPRLSLSMLAVEQGRTDQVTLDIPKGQLASLLSTSPETLSTRTSASPPRYRASTKGNSSKALPTKPPSSCSGRRSRPIK